jgi:hypothetical protein
VHDHQFVFALKLSDDHGCDALVGDLAECVLTRVGYAPAAVADILARLREALEQGGTGKCREGDVQFRAEAGQLTIVVLPASGREWRMARALPD